jgi:hypothetical protein
MELGKIEIESTQDEPKRMNGGSGGGGDAGFF